MSLDVLMLDPKSWSSKNDSRRNGPVRPGSRPGLGIVRAMVLTEADAEVSKWPLSIPVKGPLGKFQRCGNARLSDDV